MKRSFTPSPSSLTEIAADAGLDSKGSVENGAYLLISAPIVELTLTCCIYSLIYNSSSLVGDE